MFYFSKKEELAENNILFLIFTYFNSKLINRFIVPHFISYFDLFRDRRVKLNRLSMHGSRDIRQGGGVQVNLTKKEL